MKFSLRLFLYVLTCCILFSLVGCKKNKPVTTSTSTMLPTEEQKESTSTQPQPPSFEIPDKIIDENYSPNNAFLASDNDFVYTNYRMKIYKTSKNEATSIKLYDGKAIFGIAVDETYIYFTDCDKEKENRFFYSGGF